MNFELINDIVIFIGYTIFLILAALLLIKFKKMNLEIIRARIFLKKDILFKNFSYVIIAGSFLAFHEFIHIGIANGIVPYSYDLLSESLETMSLILLIMWMYTWQSMLKYRT